MSTMAGVSAEETYDLVEQAGLPALVYIGGVTRATSEAAHMLSLESDSDEHRQLEEMFGLATTGAPSNPIRRALRSATFVSDRMVVKDGAGRSRLLEVTSMPKGGELAVVLIREIALDEPKERDDSPEDQLESQLNEDLRGRTKVPGRPASQGLRPQSGRPASRAGRKAESSI